MGTKAEKPASTRGGMGNWKWFVALALLLYFATVVSADRVSASEGPTPPRLSLLDGEVSFWRPGAEDWAAAQINLALAPGDHLYTGPDGRLELQVGTQAFLRAGAESQVGLEGLDARSTSLRVDAGEISLDLRARPNGERFVFAAPNLEVQVEQPGYYRLLVGGEETRVAVRNGGSALVTPAGGSPSFVAAGEEIVVAGASGDRIELLALQSPDEWDQWNFERTAQMLAPQSARYVPVGVYGLADLDRYGRWRQVPRYGRVWVPTAVPAGWAPYSSGRWVWDPYYEWTWVDAAPWGWAPFHYGRWVYAGSYWAWAPGPVVVTPVYAPALVAFFGGGSGGFRFSVGVGVPFVSWVALGWGEPLIPWWGGAGYYGKPCWRGWGGPRIVNNVVIKNTTIVKVKDIHRYQNVRVRDGVIAVRKDRFGRSPVSRARLSGVDPAGLRPLHGRPPVEPGAKGLVEATGRGRRPPQALHARTEARGRLADGARQRRDPASLAREGRVPTGPQRQQARPQSPVGGDRTALARVPPAREGTSARSGSAAVQRREAGRRPSNQGVATEEDTRRSQPPSRAPLARPPALRQGTRPGTGGGAVQPPEERRQSTNRTAPSTRSERRYQPPPPPRTADTLPARREQPASQRLASVPPRRPAAEGGAPRQSAPPPPQNRVERGHPVEAPRREAAAALERAANDRSTRQSATRPLDSRPVAAARPQHRAEPPAVASAPASERRQAGMDARPGAAPMLRFDRSFGAGAQQDAPRQRGMDSRLGSAFRGGAAREARPARMGPAGRR